MSGSGRFARLSRLPLVVVVLVGLLAGCRASSQLPAVASATPLPGLPLTTGAASATPPVSATGAALGDGAGQAEDLEATSPTPAAAPGVGAGAAAPTGNGAGQLSARLLPSAVLSATAGLPGWQVYTDPAAGYSLSLPPGVDFRAGFNANGVYTARAQFTIPGVTGYQGLVVRVEPNATGRGLEQIVAQLYQAANPGQLPQDLLAQTQAITLTGLPAVRVSGAGQDFAVVVPYGDKIYTLAPVHSLATAAVDPQALALFEQVLQSFGITR